MPGLGGRGATGARSLSLAARRPGLPRRRGASVHPRVRAGPGRATRPAVRPRRSRRPAQLPAGDQRRVVPDRLLRGHPRDPDRGRAGHAELDEHAPAVRCRAQRLRLGSDRRRSLRRRGRLDGDHDLYQRRCARRASRGDRRQRDRRPSGADHHGRPGPGAGAASPADRQDDNGPAKPAPLSDGDRPSARPRPPPAGPRAALRDRPAPGHPSPPHADTSAQALARARCGWTGGQRGRPRARDGGTLVSLYVQ